MYWIQNRCSSLNSKNTTQAAQDISHNISFLFSRCKVYYNLKSEFLYQHYNSPESLNWDNLTIPSSECSGWEYDTALFENTFVMEVSLCKTFKTIYYDYIVIWPFFTNKSVYNIKKIQKEQISFEYSSNSNTYEQLRLMQLSKETKQSYLLYVFIYWFIE